MTSFRAALLAALCSIFIASCGDTFRPIAIPVPVNVPPAQASKTAEVVTDNGSTGTVTNFNLSGGTITGQAALGRGSSSAVLLGSRVYVTNMTDASLSVFSALTPQSPPPATITLTANSAPSALMTVPNVSAVYVLYPSLNKVGVISTVTNTETGTIPVGAGPAVLMSDSAGKKLFVGNAGSDDITVIDPANNAVTAALGAGICGDPVAMANTPDAAFVYVACHATNNVLILNADTNSVAFNIPVGMAPNSLAFDIKNKRLIVTNEGSSSVSFLAEDFTKSAAEQHVVTTVPIGAVPVDAVALPDGSRVYVAVGGGNVVVVDSTNLAIKTTISVGSAPVAIGASSDSTRVAVATTGPDTLKVIDTSTESVSFTQTLTGAAKSLLVF